MSDIREAFDAWDMQCPDYDVAASKESGLYKAFQAGAEWQSQQARGEAVEEYLDAQERGRGYWRKRALKAESELVNTPAPAPAAVPEGLNPGWGPRKLAGEPRQGQSLAHYLIEHVDTIREAYENLTHGDQNAAWSQYLRFLDQMIAATPAPAEPEEPDHD